VRSCTTPLGMSAILCGFTQGDEVSLGVETMDSIFLP
jgi:hypothetical protein